MLFLARVRYATMRKAIYGLQLTQEQFRVNSFVMSPSFAQENLVEG